jgi:predicted nucleotide-binding protein (sugar kinase/HSP70/actin superfamily)
MTYGTWKYNHDTDDNEDHRGLPPLTYHDHTAIHEITHKVYHDGVWKYHHDATDYDDGTTI